VICVDVVTKQKINISKYGIVISADFLVPEKMLKKDKESVQIHLPFYLFSFGRISQVSNTPSRNESRRISEHTSKESLRKYIESARLLYVKRN